MEKTKFDRLDFEYHVNTELMNFCIELKQKAVEVNYPYIEFFLKQVLREFDHLPKNNAYNIPGFPI
jgi:hypothetical protein